MKKEQLDQNILKLQEENKILKQAIKDIEESYENHILEMTNQYIDGLYNQWKENNREFLIRFLKEELSVNVNTTEEGYVHVKLEIGGEEISDSYDKI